MQQPVKQTPVDGWLYNPKLLYAPLRYLPLALEGLMPFRTHRYSHRWFTAPIDPTIAIPAGETVDTQLRIVPGSVIVGARFCTLGDPAGGAAPSPSLIRYLIKDSNTQKGFVDGQSRYVNCNSLVPTGGSGAAFSLFPKPYHVSSSGDNDGGGVISVSLTNSSVDTDVKCQLVLWVAEPSQIITTEESGSIMVPRVLPREVVANA